MTRPSANARRIAKLLYAHRRLTEEAGLRCCACGWNEPTPHAEHVAACLSKSGVLAVCAETVHEPLPSQPTWPVAEIVRVYLRRLARGK
jgi:hypothetical protein